jgi:predicted DNA-binding protein (UPF0251 family)
MTITNPDGLRTMPRPKRIRQVATQPRTDYFKPRGILLRELSEVVLAIEELEALRLADLDDLNQAAGAERMDVSRPTFARILHEARQKVADALVNGKALRIEGGAFEVALRVFRCAACDKEWTMPFGTGRPDRCNACGSVNISRMDGQRSGAGPGRHGFGLGHGRKRGA